MVFFPLTSLSVNLTILVSQHWHGRERCQVRRRFSFCFHSGCRFFVKGTHCAMLCCSSSMVAPAIVNPPSAFYDTKCLSMAVSRSCVDLRCQDHIFDLHGGYLGDSSNSVISSLALPLVIPTKNHVLRCFMHESAWTRLSNHGSIYLLAPAGMICLGPLPVRMLVTMTASTSGVTSRLVSAGGSDCCCARIGVQHRHLYRVKDGTNRPLATPFLEHWG